MIDTSRFLAYRINTTASNAVPGNYPHQPPPGVGPGNNGGGSGGYNRNAQVTATSPSGLGNCNSNSCMGHEWGRKHASKVMKTALDPSQLTIPTIEDMNSKKMPQDMVEMMAHNRDKMAKLMGCIGNYFINFHLLIIHQLFQLYLVSSLFIS